MHRGSQLCVTGATEVGCAVHVAIPGRTSRQVILLLLSTAVLMRGNHRAGCRDAFRLVEIEATGGLCSRCFGARGRLVESNLATKNDTVVKE